MPTVGDKVSNLDPLDLPSASAIIYAVDGGDFKVDKDGLQNWIGIGKSGVKLVKGDGTIKNFQPLLNTNSSRWTSALIPALEQATTNSKIFLYCGEYGIPSGASMVDYLDVGVTGVEVRFEKGSALIYENEVDAGEDYAFFSGTVRYGENFGAYPDSGVDMQKRIQAAFFSMPPTGDPIETIADYAALGIRTGRLLLDSGNYPISKTIWMTSHQQMYGDAGRPVNISAMVGFAPGGGSEKFMIRTARYKLDGNPAANFNFDIHIVNVLLSTTGLLNTKLSGLEYACAQGGLLDLATNGMGMRGVVIMPTSGLFKIHKLWSVAGDPDTLIPTGPEQQGPHLDIQSCGSIEISNLSLEGLNNHTSASGNRIDDYTIGGYTGNLAGLMAYNCDAIIIHNLVGESTSSLATFTECRQTSIGQADCVRANGSGVGEVMVKFADCLNIELGGITGAYFDKLYEVSTQGTVIAEADGANSQVERSGGYLSGYRADYLRANSITFPVEGTTVKAKTWTWGAGGSAANSFGQFLSVSTQNTAYIHILAQQPGGGGGEFPDGTSLSLDAGGLGGVYIPSKLRVAGATNVNTVVASGVIESSAELKSPGIIMLRSDASGLAKAWGLQAGGSAGAVIANLYSVNRVTDAVYRHMMIQPDGGVAGEMPTGYTVCFNVDGGSSGVYTPTKIRAEKGFAVKGASANPTTSDIPDGLHQTWYNSVSLQTRQWSNISSVMYKGPKLLPVSDTREVDLSSPGDIGTTTPGAISGTTGTFSGSVGIGTSTPASRFQVGSGIIDDGSYTYDDNSLIVVHQTPTSASALNDPKTVLFLGRQGTTLESYGAAAAFGLSRWVNSGVASKTRLDISLADGNDLAMNTTLTILSSGNIGIGITSPTEKLHIDGNEIVTGTSTLGTAEIITKINSDNGYQVNDIQVIGSQGSAIADVTVPSYAAIATAGANPPTDVEFNLLVASHNDLLSDMNALQSNFNTLLAAVRAHGLIAT